MVSLVKLAIFVGGCRCNACPGRRKSSCVVGDVCKNRCAEDTRTACSELYQKDATLRGLQQKGNIETHPWRKGQKCVCVDQDGWQAGTCTHDSGASGGFSEWMSDCQRGASDMSSAICALLGYCPTCNGNSLPTLWDMLPVGLPSFSGHFLDFFGAWRWHRYVVPKRR